MQSVVVGVDNSETSTRAVEFAVKYAQVNSWHLILAHVIPWSPFSFNTPTENEHRARERQHEIEAANEQILTPMAAIAQEAGVSHEEFVVHGKPSEVLTDLGEERGAVQLIVGRVGDSGLREAIFGSVASRLVQQATAPVTVVP